MSLVVVSGFPERVERYGHLWGDYEIFDPGPVDGPKAAMLAVARHAVSQGWGSDVVVIQDDVYPWANRPPRPGEQIEHGWPDHVGDVTSYHRASGPGHTCPRAFSATPTGWASLVESWQLEGRTCELWQPDHWYDRSRPI